MKKIKKYALILLYILSVAFLTIPTKYAAITKGSLSQASNTYAIDTNYKNHSFYTVSVMSYYRVTLFQKIFGNFDKSIDVYEVSEYEQSLSFSDTVKQGEISKKSSIDSSAIVAYEKARSYQLNNNLDLGYNIEIDYTFEGLIVYYASNLFKIGDLITKINGVKPNSYVEALNMLKRESVEATLVLEVLRDKETLIIDLTNVSNISLSLYPNYKINKTVPSFKSLADSVNSGGPSGGMIQTLSLFASLLKLNLQNGIIAGTGTIEMNETHTIGQIGGLNQKILTAIDAKATYFFLPKVYENEAYVISNKNKINFIFVVDINDAITRLVSLL